MSDSLPFRLLLGPKCWLGWAVAGGVLLWAVLR